MTVRKKGFKELYAKLNRITPAARAEFDKVNEENAGDVAALARVLIPARSGQARGLIKTSPGPSGGTLIDFGPLAKILEGGTEERRTRDGQSRGKGPKLPFVNPAFEATKGRRNARNKRALKKVLRNA